MDSKISIPGLGQLNTNEAIEAPESAAADATPAVSGENKNDTEMADASDPIQQVADEAIIQKTDDPAQTEIQTNGLTQIQPAATISHQDSAEDTTAQDEKDLNATEDARSVVPAEAVDVVMNEPVGDITSTEHTKESSPPASPPVTYALQAALDGLLGPTPEQSSTQTSETPIAIEEITATPQIKSTEDDTALTTEAAPTEVAGDANPEWEVDSSPYESSSDSSDTSSDDDSDVEESKLGVEETARMLMEADGGSDEEIDGARAAKMAAGVRTKNEHPDEPEPKPEITIDPEDAVLPLGIVQHIVEGTQVVIEALRDGAVSSILDRGTVLCKEDRSVLGVIHDTIATVHKPMYILKFKNDEEAKQAGLEKGSQIWYPRSHAKFVFPSQLRKEKGSDASNLHDEEVGPEEMEYSDDEMEQAHKREKKNRKRKGGKNKGGDDNESRATFDDLKYDEEDDGPYKPLSRPANFGMGLPPPPPPGISAYQSSFPSHRGGGQNPGRRGDFRGRGGRGRGFDSRGRGRGRGGGGGGHQSHSPAQTNSAHQPPPPFAAGAPPVPVPGQWPFPIPPPIPGFGAAAAPPNPSFPMPSWNAAQAQAAAAAAYRFQPVPPPNWPNAAAQQPTQQQQQQQASYAPPAGGYVVPVTYLQNVAATQTPTNNYQYPNYYGQSQNGQPQQRWG